MMKKLVLALVAFTVVFSSSAQVVFLEDFDGVGGPTAGGAGTYTFPPGWLLRNVDNGTPNTQVSYVNEAWERREDFKFSVTDSAAFSTSWNTPVVTANDWMWTPAIAVTSTNAQLSWNAVAYDPAYLDGYEVRVMVSPNVPTGGTGVIGNQITNSTVIYSTAAEAATWTSRTVSLAAYNGQTIYVGFRNNSTDKFILLIDDVKVEVLAQNDVAINTYDEFPDQYSLTPITQVHPFNRLGATIRNLGLNAATNVTLQTDIYYNGSNVYTNSTLATASLAASATSAFVTPSVPFTPSAVGNYQVRYIAKMQAADDNMLNDTAFTQIVAVTDSTYAREYGNVTSTIGIGAGTGDGNIASYFDVYQNSTITSVEYYLANGGGFTDNRTRAKVYSVAPGDSIPNTLLGTTATYVYTAADSVNGVYITAVLNPPVTVTAGTKVYVSVEEQGTEAMRLGTCPEIITDRSHRVNWSTIPTTPWSTAESFGANFHRSAVIRPNFSNADCPTALNETITHQLCTTGGSIQLAPTGGTTPYSYLWSTSATSSSITGLNAGTYDVTVTAGSCTVTESYTVTSSTLALTVNATPTAVTCTAQGSVAATVTNGTSPYTYAWSNSGTGSPISNLAAGNYTVTATDANGCTGSASATVSSTAITLSVSASNTPVNCGTAGTATATVSNGAGPYSYAWSNSATGATITNLAAGTFTVTATDANSCTGTATTTVANNSLTLTVSTTTTAAGCSTPGSVTASTSNGANPITYAWSNSATGATINVSAGTYTVTATDANGCTGTATGTVAASGSAPTVTIATTAANCNTTGQANATVTGGTSPYTYAWSNSTSANPATGLAGGNYSVTVTDAGNCTASAAATVADNSLVLSVSTSVTDAGCSSTGSVTASTTNGATPITYAWSNSGTGATINVGAGNYTVTATDANGCTGTATGTVADNSISLTVSATSTNSDCDANTGTATATVTNGASPYTYAWTGGGSAATITALAAGSYDVTVTDANGCSGTATTAVSQANAPAATFTQTDVDCNGDSTGAVNVSVTGGTTPYTYLWGNGATTEDISNVPAGAFTVTVTDNNGCTSVATGTITEPTALSVSGTVTDATTSTSADGAITLTITGGTSPYTTSPSTLTGLTAGSYNVTVTDANGCTETEAFTVGFTNGIGNVSPVVSFNVYPNPASTELNIAVELPTAANAEVKLLSVTGSIVYTAQINQLQKQVINLPVAEYAAGVYTLQLTVGGEKITRRVVLEK